MNLEEVKKLLDKSLKIKSILDEIFADLHGSEYSGLSNPLYHCAKGNLKVIKYCNECILEWEPVSLSTKEVHLKIVINKVEEAARACNQVINNSKEFNIAMPQKIKTQLGKTFEDLDNICDYFKEKMED